MWKKNQCLTRITHLFCCLCCRQSNGEWKPNDGADTESSQNNSQPGSPPLHPLHHNTSPLSPQNPLAHLNPETWKGIRCRTVRVNQTPNGHRTSSAGLTLYETQTRGGGNPSEGCTFEADCKLRWKQRDSQLDPTTSGSSHFAIERRHELRDEVSFKLANAPKVRPRPISFIVCVWQRQWLDWFMNCRRRWKRGLDRGGWRCNCCKQREGHQPSTPITASPSLSSTQLTFHSVSSHIFNILHMVLMDKRKDIKNLKKKLYLARWCAQLMQSVDKVTRKVNKLNPRASWTITVNRAGEGQQSLSVWPGLGLAWKYHPPNCYEQMPF